MTRPEDPGRFVFIVRSGSEPVIDNRFEKRRIEFRHAVWTEFLHFEDGSLQVPLQLPDCDTPAVLRPQGQPFLAALVNFYRSGKIMPCYVQIDDPCLQDAAIKLTNRACFLAPSCFQRLMRFEITPAVEQLQPLDCFWMKRPSTICRCRCSRIGRLGRIHARSYSFVPDTYGVPGSLLYRFRVRYLTRCGWRSLP
jgi:hypothetical protein